MSLSETQGCQVEELSVLYPALCRYAGGWSVKFGCIDPGQCAPDAVTKFLFDKNLRGQGRAEFDGDQIILHIPGAINQSKVLYKLIWHEVRNKCFNCTRCQKKDKFVAISDDSWATDEDEPRTRRANGISPHSPEDLFQVKELLMKSLDVVSDPVQRLELYLRAKGASYKDIAQLTERAPQTIRQGVKRNKQRIVRALGKIFTSRRGK